METLFFEKNWIGRILAATIFLCLTISSIAAQTTGHFDGVWLGKNANGDLIINLEIDTEKKNVANSYKTNCFNAGFMTISTIEPNGNKSVLQTFELTLESQNTNSVIFKSLNPQLHSRSATYIKRNGLLIRKITIKSSRPFQCAYHPLTP